MHPGEMLREKLVVPLGLTAGKLAKACNVPRTRIERIVNEEMGISADTAVRLGKVLGTSAEFWLNLQARYDRGSPNARLANGSRAWPSLIPRRRRRRRGGLHRRLPRRIMASMNSMRG
jgi:addiction module HigA family antidote